MPSIPPLDLILYHYTDEEHIEKIKESGILKPSKPGEYLSLNINGKFDEVNSDRRTGLLGGRSETPNIFLTDAKPDEVSIKKSNKNYKTLGATYFIDYAVILTVSDILEQGFKVYKNPSTEYSFYNVPCPEGSTLKINPDKIIKI